MSETESLETRATKASYKLKTAHKAVEQIIFGQDKTITLCLSSILSGGHFLIVGLPGLGKTKLVETLGTVLGLENNRIQYTPDLMPSDILGSEILKGDAHNRSFEFIKGPIFCQLLMADEINRASPRTQSALLQAMQEYKISIGGKTYPLPKPFHVMATQNPLEQEGTYPLPEAQLDRFIMEIDINYPSYDAEKEILKSTVFEKATQAEKILNTEELIEIQSLVKTLPVGEKIVDGILKLVQSTRPDQTKIKEIKNYVAWGASPRASQAFMLASRAKALLEGRFSPSMDDVIELAPAILKHRMSLNFSAKSEGMVIQDIIEKVCEEV